MTLSASRTIYVVTRPNSKRELLRTNEIGEVERMTGIDRTEIVWAIENTGECTTDEHKVVAL